MNLPSNPTAAALLAVGVAIGTALAVALSNMAFLGAAVATGTALMAVQTSRQHE